MGREHPLTPTARLRRVGRNHLHPELAHRAPELRHMHPVHPRFREGRLLPPASGVCQ